MAELLIVVAIICFVISAIPIGPKIPWMSIGLAFFAAGHILTRIVIE